MVQRAPSSEPTPRQQWVQSAAYMNACTAEAELQRDFDAARTRGAKRTPETKHIVVHPEYPWNADNMRMRGDYADRIKHVLRNEDAVVITYPGARDDFAGFPYAEKSEVASASENKWITGIMDHRGLRDLLLKLGGLNERDRYVMHGSSFGLCVSAAACQLYAITDWDVYMPPEPPQGAERKHINMAMCVIGQLKLLQEKFRMGYVHNTKNKQWGEAEFDMLGPGTQVY